MNSPVSLSKPFLLINKTKKCHCELLLWRLLNALPHSLSSIKGRSQCTAHFNCLEGDSLCRTSTETVDRMQNIHWFYSIHSKNDESPQWRAESETDTQQEQGAYKTTLIWVYNSLVMYSRVLLQTQWNVTGMDLMTGIKNENPAGQNCLQNCLSARAMSWKHRAGVTVLKALLVMMPHN